jgi:predicted transcriptional regulator of viral defense system
MKFRAFESEVKDLPFFSLNVIRKFDPGFHRRQLVDWQQRGYIQSLAGGAYILVGREVDEGLLFMAANQIYQPSYVSLESALAYYQVIPESVLGVTSVSARKTKQIESSWGQFSYRSVKPEYMFGYQVIDPQPHQKFLVATLEKAVLDYLYLNTHIQNLNDFDALRWNRAALAPLIDNANFGQYLRIFDKKALRDRVKVLMRYFNA